MKQAVPNIELQNATLKAKLKRAKARINKLKSASPANVERVHPTDKERKPYIVADGKNAEGSHFRERRREQGSRIIVLVPGGDVGEILKRIA